MATIPAETPHTSRARRKRVYPPKKTQIELAREFDALPLDALVTTAQLAAFLNCSQALLERHRWAGTGPVYIKNGRLVRYSKRLILDRMREQIRISTTVGADAA